MIEAANFPYLTVDSVYQLRCFHDSINFTICETSTSKCHLDECQNCPGTKALSGQIQEVFDADEIASPEVAAVLIVPYLTSVGARVYSSCRSSSFLVWSFFVGVPCNHLL